MLCRALHRRATPAVPMHCIPLQRALQLDELLASGYVDAFREVSSDRDEFSWWPDGERGDNGWRTDFHIISQGLKYAVDYGAIYKIKEFSSHAPVIMDYDIEI